MNRLHSIFCKCLFFFILLLAFDNGKQTERVLNWIIWTVFRMSNKKFSLFSYCCYYCCCCNIAFYRKRFHPFFSLSLTLSLWLGMSMIASARARHHTVFECAKKCVLFFGLVRVCSAILLRSVCLDCSIDIVAVLLLVFRPPVIGSGQWDACISYIEPGIMDM